MPARQVGRRQGADQAGGARNDEWLAIKVELVGVRGRSLSRPPGRVFAASSDHSFSALAGAIDRGFARWDLGHLHEFQLADGTRVGIVDEDAEPDLVDEQRAKLARLKRGDEFVYVFDLGDAWTHRCTVGRQGIDPLESLGIVPREPTAFFGWGVIPDQHGRTSGEEAEI